MLVDLPKEWLEAPNHPFADAVKGAGFTYASYRQFGPGMYGYIWGSLLDHLLAEHNPFQGHLDARDGTGESMRALAQELQRQKREDVPQDYGLCDYPEQVAERWPQLAADPRPFLINYSRFDLTKTLNFKPEKFGPYIGTREWHQMDDVWHFQIFQLKEEM
ncbi:hypothetical protein ABZ897_50680 [Nonomuraea sp. NPDC046802]|uniref:hypothetical protein n=1 Tax=Nonomuraea sp. NPDC046802 TaxID=3154919 RepID=UPI0033F02EFB